MQQESPAGFAVLLPLACGTWKAISEIIGLFLLLSALYSCCPSYKRHFGIIKTRCTTKKEGYYYGEGKSEEVVI